MDKSYTPGQYGSPEADKMSFLQKTVDKMALSTKDSNYNIIEQYLSSGINDILIAVNTIYNLKYAKNYKSTALKKYPNANIIIKVMPFDELNGKKTYIHNKTKYHVICYDYFKPV